jgi:hypothetical protein
MLLTSMGNGQYKRRKNNIDLVAAFCLLMGTSPINFALLGSRKRKYYDETTSKLEGKIMLIAMVRGLHLVGHKICCLSWLANSVLIYEPKCGGSRGGGGGLCGLSA